MAALVSRLCRHKNTSGEWISPAHAQRCLGVPRRALAQALLGGQLRYRWIGHASRDLGLQHFLVYRADALALLGTGDARIEG